MIHADKYKPMYFPAPEACYDWVTKDHVENPPIWCSVDLRDGNQALIIPMSLAEAAATFMIQPQKSRGCCRHSPFTKAVILLPGFKGRGRR